MTERDILEQVCIRENCTQRCPLTKKSELYTKLHIIVKGGTTMLVGVLLGCLLTSVITMRAKGQPIPITHFNAVTITTDIAVLTNEVHGMKESMHDLTAKVEKVQSQADITQATGAGIGLAITFLQLLGLFVKSKERA
jgi:hypothetical protein